MKIMLGAFSLAILKTSLTILGPSPKYFWTNSDPTTLMKVASVSPAIALAIIVFPVPGGPYMRIPLGGSIPSFSNNSGCFKGSSIASRISCFYTSSPPMSEKRISDLFWTFIIWMFTSASVGKMSTIACECLLMATEQFGLRSSLSKIERIQTM